MKNKIIALMGLLLFIVSGCGNQTTIITEGPYEFKLPDSSTAIEFSYPTEFEVTEEEGRILFLIEGQENIIFDYANMTHTVENGEEFVGDGWVGVFNNGQIGFASLDNKYQILISGQDDDVLYEFASYIKVMNRYE